MHDSLLPKKSTKNLIAHGLNLYCKVKLRHATRIKHFRNKNDAKIKETSN